MPTPEFVLALRRRVGHAQLWLPGVTAVVRRGEQVLLVRRADNGQWTPIGGIVEPGEQPAECARREVLEEAGVRVRVDRLSSVDVTEPMTYPNGDRVVFLNHTFTCTWLDGEAYPADEESTDVGWFDSRRLPELRPDLHQRISDALADEVATRFTRIDYLDEDR